MKGAPFCSARAAEAGRVVSLFRRWLTTVQGLGVRQGGYSTASGEVIELFADATLGQSELQAQLDQFSEIAAGYGAQRRLGQLHELRRLR